MEHHQIRQFHKHGKRYLHCSCGAAWEVVPTPTNRDMTDYEISEFRNQHIVELKVMEK